MAWCERLPTTSIVELDFGAGLRCVHGVITTTYYRMLMLLARRGVARLAMHLRLRRSLHYLLLRFDLAASQCSIGCEILATTSSSFRHGRGGLGNLVCNIGYYLLLAARFSRGP